MTVAEAREWLRKALTDEYRRECIAYWREHCGEAFVAKVMACAS